MCLRRTGLTCEILTVAIPLSQSALHAFPVPQPNFATKFCQMTIGCQVETIPQKGVPYNAYDIQSFFLRARDNNQLRLHRFDLGVCVTSCGPKKKFCTIAKPSVLLFSGPGHGSAGFPRCTVQSTLANSNHFVPSRCVRNRVMFESMKTL
jgi:hypothetical protein